MVDLTDNHEFQLWADNEERWEHRSDFETLEQRVWVRDEDAALNDYEPHDGALFLATDTETVYLGDGNSWTLKWNFSDIGSSGGGDHTYVEGIATTRQNVGAVVGGGYHSSLASNGGYGVVFEAEDLTIQSVVVDADLSGGGSSTVPVELRQYEGGTADTVVDSTTISVSGGPERVTLDVQVPAAGASDADANNEYILARGAQPDNATPLRRRFVDDGDWSAADYDEQTYTDPPIDFLDGGHTNNTTVGENSWYYFFDWLVGPEETRVTSPWSTDVDEIYMRPRDPTEEYDDVSPRAIWFDTSR